MKKNSALKSNLRLLRVVNGQGHLLVISMFIGVIGGVGAIGFHTAMEWLSHTLLGDVGGLVLYSETGEGAIPRWLFFLVPVFGGLVSGLLTYTFAPETQGHGTDAAIDTFHNRGGRVRPRVPLIKAVTSLVTISSGGSAGVEGPVAQIGSGMGALFTRLFQVSVKYRRILTLAGMAAGLGAIFKAPLGGALTSVEVLYKEDFESDAFMTSIVASVVGYVTYCSAVGYHAFFGWLPSFIFDDPVELIFYALMGLLMAPASWLFVKMFYAFRSWFTRLPGPAHIKPAIGGLGVGLLFYLEPNVLAGGWDVVIEHMVMGRTGVTVALGLLLLGVLKMLATSFTVGSGGSGGVFGPALFTGGMVGGAVGTFFHHFFPEHIHHPGAFVLVGMGAFFSGIANAPIAATIMVCELSGNYNLLAPLMLSSQIHIFMARRWSIYENQVHNKFQSNAHRSELHVDVLQNVVVKDVVKEKSGIVIVSPSDTLKDLEFQMANTEEDIFLVSNDGEHLQGTLDVHDLRKAIFDKSVSDLIIVEDLMEKPVFLTLGMDLHYASQVFLRKGISQMPVIENGKIYATLRHRDIINTYDRVVRKGHDLRKAETAH